MERQTAILLIFILVMIAIVYIYNNPSVKIIHNNKANYSSGNNGTIGNNGSNPAVCTKCIKGTEAVNKSGYKYSTDLCFLENGILTPTNFISGEKNRCFYNAVSFAIFGTINRWEEMRKKAWGNINLLDYETDLLHLNVHSIMELEEKYPDGLPTDIMFAKPLAFALKRKISVYAQESGFCYVFNIDGTYKVYEAKLDGIKRDDICCGTIKLFFNKNHYELFEFKFN